mmetsp:Transcript_4999/g.8269  ORF Transcript_4999/g.8269 Transcript_4999/m.8269 type:complete len:422 (-) Transcript_4999:91-1356(-)
MSETAVQWQRYCEENGLQTKIFYRAVLPCVLGIIFGIWLLVKLVRGNADRCRRCCQCLFCSCECCRCCSQGTCLWKHGTVMYWLGLILVINNVLYFIATMSTALSKCRPGREELAKRLNHVATIFYFIDWLLVILLFYLRLVFVFDKNSFHLAIVPSRVTCRCVKDNECTLPVNWKMLFWTGAVTFVIVCIAAIPVGAALTIVEMMPLLLLWIFLVLANIFLLMGTYLWKMSRLYRRVRGSNRTDPALRHEVIKSSMLAVVSLSLTLLSFFLLPTSLGAAHQNAQMVEEFTRRLDTLTYVVCVVFLFCAFARVYDRRLKWCQWGRCFTHCAKHGVRCCCEPCGEEDFDAQDVGPAGDTSVATKNVEYTGSGQTAVKPGMSRVISMSDRETVDTKDVEYGGCIELKVGPRDQSHNYKLPYLY